MLCLPVLFAAGMTLLDTIDGSFMNFAYGWAFSEPVRKVYYNLIMTGLSVIGRARSSGRSSCSRSGRRQARAHGGFWGWVSGVDINTLGYVIVALFIVTWAAALLIWRFGRIERRWAFHGESGS